MSVGWILTAEQRDVATLRYSRRESVKVIAAAYGVSSANIVQNARRRGIRRPKRATDMPMCDIDWATIKAIDIVDGLHGLPYADAVDLIAERLRLARAEGAEEAFATAAAMQKAFDNA